MQVAGEVNDVELRRLGIETDGDARDVAAVYPEQVAQVSEDFQLVFFFGGGRPAERFCETRRRADRPGSSVQAPSEPCFAGGSQREFLPGVCGRLVQSLRSIEKPQPRRRWQ